MTEWVGNLHNCDLILENAESQSFYNAFEKENFKNCNTHNLNFSFHSGLSVFDLTDVVRMYLAGNKSLTELRSLSLRRLKLAENFLKADFFSLSLGLLSSSDEKTAESLLLPWCSRGFPGMIPNMQYGSLNPIIENMT